MLSFFGGEGVERGGIVTVSPEPVYVTTDGMICETRIANMKNVGKIHVMYDKFNV